MATTYRKTPKGLTEIETRVHRVPPRARTLLILVNGQRSEAELAKLAPAEAAQTLQWLLAEGFIAPVAGVEPGPASDHMSTRAATSTPPVTGDPLAAFIQRRREAIHVLTDQLGPGAESLAIRMEKCRGWDEMLPVLDAAVNTLRLVRGASAATTFSARFIDPPA
jgi:hypothetical protein